MTYNLTRLADAQRAVEYLIEHDGYVALNKTQFAYAMDWYMRDGKKADRRRVEEVCNLTRDQEQYPDVFEVLGGYVIGYSPTEGGMSLADLNGGLPLEYTWHKLRGDMQVQQRTRTQNQRRLPMWKASGTQAANQDDHEMARLCWQAENEIRSTGFVTGSLMAELMKAFGARGIEGNDAT